VKIEKQSDGRTAIIWLIGRIRSEDLGELRAQMGTALNAWSWTWGDEAMRR
jgi:hypothetical protein